MKAVINLPRYYAQNWTMQLKKDMTIWICIGEPEVEFVRNSVLESCPHLYINFWDLKEPVPLVPEPLIGEKFLYPPSSDDAKKIVDFILEHKDKNILVNCAAGISRSGAVAKFCADKLGYSWMEEGKRHALPNEFLYNLMCNYYNEI